MDNNRRAMTLKLLREWLAETRARQALQDAVSAKWHKPYRTRRQIARAHEAAHFVEHALRWSYEMPKDWDLD